MITLSPVHCEISYSDNFGQLNAKEVKYRMNSSRIDFVIKQGNHCSVSLCDGTLEDIRKLTLLFIVDYKPKTLVNQVHSIKELKAMYKAGLRVPIEKNGIKVGMPLKYALEFLEERPSVLVALDAKVPWDYE